MTRYFVCSDIPRPSRFTKSKRVQLEVLIHDYAMSFELDEELLIVVDTIAIQIDDAGEGNADQFFWLPEQH